MKKQSKFGKWFLREMGSRKRWKTWLKTTDTALMRTRHKGVMADLELTHRKQWDNNKAIALEAWNAARKGGNEH